MPPVINAASMRYVWQALFVPEVQAAGVRHKSSTGVDSHGGRYGWHRALVVVTSGGWYMWLTLTVMEADMAGIWHPLLSLQADGTCG